MIRAVFDFTEEEIKEYYRFFLIFKVKIKILYYLMATLLLIVGFLIGYFADQFLITVLFALVSAGLLFYFPRQLENMIKKQAKSTYRKENTQIIFLEECTQVIYQDKTQDILYASIVEVAETNRFYYFFFSKKQAIVINKEKQKEEVLVSLSHLIEKEKWNHLRYDF